MPRCGETIIAPVGRASLSILETQGDALGYRISRPSACTSGHLLSLQISEEPKIFFACGARKCPEINPLILALASVSLKTCRAGRKYFFLFWQTGIFVQCLAYGIARPLDACKARTLIAINLPLIHH